MNFTLDDPGVFLGYASVSSDQLQALARTYDRAAAPVWVETPSGECVYRNRQTDVNIHAPSAFATFDILDFNGKVVAYLRTVAHA